MRLRALDDRWLPPAAAWLRGSLDTLGRQRARVVQGAGSLRPEALDARWSGTAVIDWLVRRPALALLVTASLLVMGVGSAAWLDRDTPVAAEDVIDPGDLPDGGLALLGPGLGESTQEYERAATQGLVRAVQEAAGQPRLALVSLSGYRTPGQAASLLAGVKVERVFLRAPEAGEKAAALPVEIRGDLLLALEQIYAETVKNRLAAASAYQGYIRQLSGSSKDDQTFRELYLAFERASRLEAREYSRDCACVFSALVTATPSQLLPLRSRPGVRAIEVAAAELPLSLAQVQPLLPEVVGTVQKPGAGGGR